MRHTLWLLQFALLFYSSQAGSSPPSCRCMSYQPCWPSASEFSHLESQLSLPLIKPTPPASACYPLSNPSANCSSVQEHLSDALWRSNLPGSMQSINFESYTFENGTIDACYYNTTLGYPCDQGNIPILGVNAQKVGDIQAAVKFAKQHNLRLIVKNTGHDFLGRSAGRGGFMIWTHNLKNITYDDHFIPDGAPSSESYQAITFGAGVQWIEGYAAAKANGRFIIGGISTGMSIGTAGGWIQGGGHSGFSPKYGLGVDNAVQFTIVLASGEYVIANHHQNSDLFWALRGGGGGTYGVVVTVTYRTFDIFPFTLVSNNVTFSTPEIAKKIITKFVQLHPSLSDAEWGGYSSWSNTSLNYIYLAPNTSLSEANATMKPFVDYALSVMDNPQDFQIQVYPFNSSYEFFDSGFNAPGGSGELIEFTSRLMSRKMVQEQPEKVAEMTLAVGGFNLLFVAGGAVGRVDPDSMGLNPAWREAIGVMIGGSSWDEGASAAEIQSLRQVALDQLNNYLDKVSVNSGTYFNEASLYEKDPKKTFFGPHYKRLKQIKRKHDADDLFLVAEGVGSDDWDKSLNCRLH